MHVLGTSGNEKLTLMMNNCCIENKKEIKESGCLHDLSFINEKSDKLSTTTFSIFS